MARAMARARLRAATQALVKTRRHGLEAGVTPREYYLRELLPQLVRSSSEVVSRQIVRASGRTNSTINIVAKISATVGVGVIIGCGVVTVLWFGFDAVPREVADWLTFPSVEQASRAATMLVGGLGTGLLARGAGHCVREFGTGVRLTAVTCTHILFLALLVFLWTTLIGPLF